MKGEKLKDLLVKIEVTQAELARGLGVSGATVSQLVRHAQWPKRLPGFEQRLESWLLERGADMALVRFAIRELGVPVEADPEEAALPGDIHGEPLLRRLMRRHGLTMLEAGQRLGISKSSFSQLLVHGIKPHICMESFRRNMTRMLLLKGAPEGEVRQAFDELENMNWKWRDHSRGQSATDSIFSHFPLTEDTIMARKQVLTQAARQKFRISREIFGENLSEADDVFVNEDIEYAMACLGTCAKYGGMLALVGESGGGKTTVWQLFQERLRLAEGERYKVFEPYVLGMNNSHRRSRGMTVNDICDCILTGLIPEQLHNQGVERRFKAMHEALVESCQAGYRHILKIEEAHSVPLDTIKEFKRIYELKHGMKRVLSIVCLGQTELRNRLSEADHRVREVVQRMEIVELPPLSDVEAYTRHRCQRAGAQFDHIFEPGAMGALAEKLTESDGKGLSGIKKSYAYPLLVGNILTCAMNTAADLGMERVSAEVVREV